MSYYDQFGRRTPRPGPGSRRPGGRGDMPTLEDFVQLRDAYNHLEAQLEATQKELAATQEALRQQTKKAMDLDTALQETRKQVEALQAELKAAEEQQQHDWQDRYLRLQAEMENLRRRLDERSRLETEQSRLRILEDMLPLADHLEMALEHLAKSTGKESPELIEAFRSSLEATRQAFLDSLARHGVQPMDPLGEQFDPERHEAIGLAPGDEYPEDHVAQVVQPGYEASGRLLRPARVLVSRGKTQEDANQ